MALVVAVALVTTQIGGARRSSADFAPTSPPVLWRVQVGIAGAVTPTIVDGVAYVVGRDSHTQSLIAAYDVETGRERWRVLTSEYTDFLNAPVAVGDGRVFAGLSDGSLLTLDAATGETLWREPGLPEEVYSLGTTPVVNGDMVLISRGVDSSSPVVADGVVIVGGGRGLRLAAYDAEHGYTQWETVIERIEDATYELSGYWGFDLATGARLWFVPTVSPRNVDPVVNDGVVWGAAQSGSLDRIPSRIFAIDIQTGELVPTLSRWLPGFPFAGPTFTGALMVLRSGNALQVIDVLDGGRPRKTNLIGPSDDRPVIDGDLVYVGTPDGSVMALSLTTLQPRWLISVNPAAEAYALAPQIMSPAVALAGDLLVVSTFEGALIALDVHPEMDEATPMAMATPNASALPGAETPSASPRAANSVTVTVRVAVHGYAWPNGRVDLPNLGEPCIGAAAFQDVGKDTRVIVASPDGVSRAMADLGTGIVTDDFDGTTVCRFETTVTGVPDDLGAYLVAVGNRMPQGLSRRDFQESNWTVTFEFGD